MLDVTAKPAQLARTLLGMGAALVLAACATQAEISSDYDRSADFAAFHTFTLSQREHPGISNPLLAVRVEQDIKEQQRKSAQQATQSAEEDLNSARQAVLRLQNELGSRKREVQDFTARLPGACAMRVTAPSSAARRRPSAVATPWAVKRKLPSRCRS